LWYPVMETMQRDCGAEVLDIFLLPLSRNLILLYIITV
jgi:hypothetical protein